MPLTPLSCLRDLAKELLQREMPVTYETMPDNWNRLRVAGICSHLDRIHYSKWPDNLKQCVHEHVWKGNYK